MIRAVATHARRLFSVTLTFRSGSSISTTHAEESGRGALAHLTELTGRQPMRLTGKIAVRKFRPLCMV